MTTSNHTPGPWHIDGRDVCAWVGEADGGIETTICECFDHATIGRKNSEENAKLIAAAPELLEALRKNMDLLDWFLEATSSDATIHGREDVHAALKQARTAIAKATGAA